VHFLKLGWKAVVNLIPTALLPDADLAIVSTHSRGLPPGEAKAVVRELAGRLRRENRPVLYKKMDSTLHGNFAVELDALLEIGPALGALVCPAFPDMGRRLIHGDLLMGSERRSVGRNLVARLREQSQNRVVHFDLTSVRLDPGQLGDRVRTALEPGPALIAFDAEEEEDLHRVVAVSRRLGSMALLCGSTGLARALATPPHSTPPPFRSHLSPAGPVVCCIGSQSPVTHQQIARFTEKSGARVMSVTADLVPELNAALGQPAPIVLRLTLGATDLEHLPAVLQVLRGRPPRGLVLSGGETAQAVCSLAGVTAICLGGEFVTGLPHGTLLGGWFDGWPVATKAGGFGEPGALVQCEEFFTSIQAACAE